MKLDKNELIVKTKYCIDDFCRFMYFLWVNDAYMSEPMNPIIGKVVAITIATIVFLVVPAFLLLALQGLLAILFAIITHPLIAIRIVVTVSLILALPISGLVFCYKRGKKLEDADNGDDY